MTTQHDLYEHDFHAWAELQARLLRRGQIADASLEHIAEESETLGAGERRELENRLKVLLLRLLEWQSQPENRSSEWIQSNDEQRDQIDTLLRQSPSIKLLVPEDIDYAYPKAGCSALRETGLSQDVFPTKCAFSGQAIIDPEFLPDQWSVFAE